MEASLLKEVVHVWKSLLRNLGEGRKPFYLFRVLAWKDGKRLRQFLKLILLVSKSMLTMKLEPCVNRSQGESSCLVSAMSS